MAITTIYKAHTLNPGKLFRETIRFFRKALAFVISVVDSEWDGIDDLDELHRKNDAEHLIHVKRSNDAEHDFDARFPKMPSYFRCPVIAQAIGTVYSRRSRFPDAYDPAKRAMPVFYDCYRSSCAAMLAGESDTVRLKLFDGQECIGRMWSSNIRMRSTWAGTGAIIRPRRQSCARTRKDLLSGS